MPFSCGSVSNRRSGARRTSRSCRLLLDETGSTIPLILGFFLLALLVVGGAVALSDVFGRQRGLQSVCDGAAARAANAADAGALHGAGTGLSAVPLGGLDSVLDSYLVEVQAAPAVRASGSLDPTGTRVRLVCTRVSRVAFDALLGRPDGVEQTATAEARSPLGP